MGVGRWNISCGIFVAQPHYLSGKNLLLLSLLLLLLLLCTILSFMSFNVYRERCNFHSPFFCLDIVIKVFEPNVEILVTNGLESKS